MIEEILRINRGSVEKTIDQLLSISGDTQVKKKQFSLTVFLCNFENLQCLNFFSQSENFQHDLISDVNKSKATTNSDSSLSKPKSSYPNRNWNPVLLKDLDQNFLRITHDCDEFAVMLQNEEFLAELR